MAKTSLALAIAAILLVITVNSKVDHSYSVAPSQSRELRSSGGSSSGGRSGGSSSSRSYSSSYYSSSYGGGYGGGYGGYYGGYYRTYIGFYGYTYGYYYSYAYYGDGATRTECFAEDTECLADKAKQQRDTIIFLVVFLGGIGIITLIIALCCCKCNSCCCWASNGCCHKKKPIKAEKIEIAEPEQVHYGDPYPNQQHGSSIHIEMNSSLQAPQQPIQGVYPQFQPQMPGQFQGYPEQLQPGQQIGGFSTYPPGYQDPSIVNAFQHGQPGFAQPVIGDPNQAQYPPQQQPVVYGQGMVIQH